MSYLRNDDYTKERERPKLFSHYLEKMTLYLKTLYPDRSEEEIDSFVKSVIMEKAKAPVIEAIVHPSEGNSEVVKMTLDKYITNVIKDNNIVPSGSVYHRVSVKESFLRKAIERKVKERSHYKKLHFEFADLGKMAESVFYFLSQANAKIFNNAIAGGMKITQFILGSKAGFNAITSIGRISVKQGYSIIERLVAGNIYLPTWQSVVSYILNHASVVPQDFIDLYDQQILYVPTVKDVSDYLVRSLANYTLNPKREEIDKVLVNLNHYQLAYVFYCGCLINLCERNDTLMRSLIDSCFARAPIDPLLYKDIDVAEVKTFKDDVLTCILSTNYQLLGKHPKKEDQWNSIKDAKEHNPEGLKEFIYVCRHFVTNYEKILFIIKPLFKIQTTFSKLTFQQRMARFTVPLSDTDSNIFTTQQIVKWKSGEINFSQESYEMNAFTTYLISQTLEHVFARLSAGFGVEGKDVFKISMKNEFLYPISITTSLGKHYLAIATMQEGYLLPKPRKDIKGVGFRSSAYPGVIKEGFIDFVTKLFKSIETKYKIRASHILDHVANLEREIYESIMVDHESTYLQTVAVRRAEDYADPDSSAYFYYKLWQEVFSSKYGEMVIPNKCFKIPLIGNKKLFRNPEFLEKLKETQPDIYEKLIVFNEKYNDRDMTSILIPPLKGKINPFFVEIMDIRAHISQTLSSYYLLLDSLGIGTVNKAENMLVTDFYDPSKKEFTQ